MRSRLRSHHRGEVGGPSRCRQEPRGSPEAHMLRSHGRSMWQRGVAARLHPSLLSFHFPQMWCPSWRQWRGRQCQRKSRSVEWHKPPCSPPADVASGSLPCSSSRRSSRRPTVPPRKDGTCTAVPSSCWCRLWLSAPLFLVSEFEEARGERDPEVVSRLLSHCCLPLPPSSPAASLSPPLPPKHVKKREERRG